MTPNTKFTWQTNPGLENVALWSAENYPKKILLYDPKGLQRAPKDELWLKIIIIQGGAQNLQWKKYKLPVQTVQTNGRDDKYSLAT